MEHFSNHRTRSRVSKNLIKAWLLKGHCIRCLVERLLLKPRKASFMMTEKHKQAHLGWTGDVSIHEARENAFVSPWLTIIHQSPPARRHGHEKAKESYFLSKGAISIYVRAALLYCDTIAAQFDEIAFSGSSQGAPCLWIKSAQHTRRLAW